MAVGIELVRHALRAALIDQADCLVAQALRVVHIHVDVPLGVGPTVDASSHIAVAVQGAGSALPGVEISVV